MTLPAVKATCLSCIVCFAIISWTSGLNTALGQYSGYDDTDLEIIEYPSLSLASIELRTPAGKLLELQNAMAAGQEVVISTTVSTVSGGVPDQDIIVTYLVQAKDEEDIVQFVNESEFVIQQPISQLDITWTPEHSGIYSIEIFVWIKVVEDGGNNNNNNKFIPMVEKGRIINVFAGPSHILDVAELPSGISLEIEKLGTRQFYQDRDMFLPTQLSVTRNETVDWGMIAWPSIGPNYIISKLGSSAADEDSFVVYDYYKSLGIDAEMKNLQYDEFMKSADLQPYPAMAGRYFGFGWNQTDMDGVKVPPGEYQAQLIMPILIGDISTGDDKRVRVILTSAPERFTLLAGPPQNLQHHLVLKQIINQTELQTGEAYEYSLILINTGDQEEYFSLLSNPCPWEGAGGLVYPWYFNGPLMPGESYFITDGIAEGSKYPGIYYLNGSYVFAVPDESLEGKSENDDGVRASCIEIEPNPIVLNVTAPTFEDVKLVLESDKQVYKRNETVHLSLYIENNSDKPFVLSEVVPSLLITTSNGTEISLGWVADYFRPIAIDPHSTFRLDNTLSLDWDLNDVYQIPPYPDDGYSPAEPGIYSIEATFVSPYLKSETLTITILE